MSGTEFIYWQMLAATLAMLTCFTASTAPAPVRVSIYRRLKRDVVPNLIGAAPGAALIYLLYIAGGMM